MRMFLLGLPLFAVTMVSAQMDYPAAFRNLKLPELTGATIASTGRQTTSLRDGIRIDLETTMPVQEVLAYYREQMAPLGWKDASPPARMKSPMMGGATFTHEALTLTLTVTRMGETTKVGLNLVEK